jgi:hypothetical protein
MKKYLYYPNFEPPNTNWLKFAILYFEKFESIIPYNREHLISDDYRKLRNETDLVEFYSPEYLQGERASIRAIEEAEKIFQNRYLRSPLFNEVNVYRKWQDTSTWDYQIYGEKFSFHWAEFCESNRIGVRNNDGILLPKSLAFLYMTHLAKEISFERDSKIITDNLDFDNYTNFARIQPSNRNVRDKFLKGIINLLVPNNVNEISLDKLIAFRKINRELITALNNQITNVEDSISNGLTEKEFVDSFNNSLSEFSQQVLLLGVGVASIPFTAYLLINNPQALTSEYTEEILGALSIGFGGYYGVRKGLFDSREQRQCKKYFSNLRRLQQ